LSTIFDFLTVGAFLAMVVSYFLLVNGDQKLLPKLLICAIAFAVANQLGNRGYVFFAVLLLVAGVAYSFHLFRRRNSGS